MQINTEPHDAALDYDLEHGCDENSLKSKFKNILHLWAQVPGQADGPKWYWIVEMKSAFEGKRYGLFQGGCDYTGWDCQSYLDFNDFDSIEEACNAAKDDYERKNVADQLLKQLKGEQPYGLYIEPSKN